MKWKRAYIYKDEHFLVLISERQHVLTDQYCNKQKTSKYRYMAGCSN